MKYAGKFQHLAGLVVGEFGKDSTPGFKEEVYQLIHEAVEDYTYPCLLYTSIARTFSPTVAGSDIICEDFILAPENKCQQAIDVTVGNVSRQFENLPLPRNYANNITATFEKSGSN